MKRQRWVEDEIRRLQENGFWFWSGKVAPDEEIDPEVQLLRETREPFHAVLRTSTPASVIDHLLNPPLPLKPALALKHAMIASDMGAELIDRAKDYIAFHRIATLTITDLAGSRRQYTLKTLGLGFKKRLSNRVITKAPTDLLHDLAVIVIFGSQLEEFQQFPSFRRCCLGRLCGNSQALNDHFAQLYLEVSRQISGRQTARSGLGPQTVVRRYLEKRLAGQPRARLRQDNRVPNFAVHTKRQFDIVAEVTTPREVQVYVAVEVAFQETTNSVIERKAREAGPVFRNLKSEGNFLCYVVDGAGYFARSKALADIIENSHRQFTFKESELEALCCFIEEISEGRHS